MITNKFCFVEDDNLETDEVQKMKIDDGTSYLFANKQAHTKSQGRTESQMTFDMILAKETEGNNDAEPTQSKPVDFRSMTHHDLMSWVSQKVHSDEMTFEEGTAIALGFGRVPIGGYVGQSTGFDKGARIDFLDLAQRGIEFALSRSDRDGAERLQRALNIMNNYQGRDTGIHLKA